MFEDVLGVVLDIVLDIVLDVVRCSINKCAGVVYGPAGR